MATRIAERLQCNKCLTNNLISNLKQLINGINISKGSLFAYGQTGSGKSYSMVGYGANK